MKYSNKNNKKNNKKGKKSKKQEENIWYEDIGILFNPDYFSKAFPAKEHNLEEKFNSIMRLSIYVTILLIVITGNYNYIFVILFVAVITYLIHINIDYKEEKKMKDNVENYSNIKEDNDIKKRNIKPKKYLKKCVLPSEDNPFMNFLVSDKRNRKEACKSYNNEEINDLVEDKFNVGLYKDINSVYNNENSQREFYTMPNTKAANAQTEFANWLYYTPKTCKEGNGNQCVGNNMERLEGESYKFY